MTYSEELIAALDGLESIHLSQRINRPLRFFFNSRVGAYAKANLDDFWTSAGLTCGPGGIIAAYTRRAFTYPLLMCWTKLLAPNADLQYYIGFETGSMIGTGIAMIGSNSGGAITFTAGCRVSAVGVAITNMLPADYLTVSRAYSVKVNKCSAEFWIDGVLKAIILLGVSEGLPTWTSGPYALRGNISPMAAALPAFIELNPLLGTYTLPCNIITDNAFVASDGDPLPPQQLAMYNENTAVKWNGQVPAAAITSHPVPVWGYARPTLFFQADAAGTLKIQVYAGGAWRDYNTTVVTANQLEVITLSASVPLARCVYTPVAAGVDVIAVGEWYLS